MASMGAVAAATRLVWYGLRRRASFGTLQFVPRLARDALSGRVINRGTVLSIAISTLATAVFFGVVTACTYRSCMGGSKIMGTSRRIPRIPILGQLLILVLFIAVVSLLQEYIPPSLALASPRIAAIITTSLALLSISLLFRRHLQSCALPPGTPIAVRISEPHLVAILLTGASLLLTLSVASIVGTAIGTLGLVGLAANVGRYAGRRSDNNRMLAWSVGSMLLLIAVKLPAILPG